MSNGLIQAALVNAWLEDYQGLDGVRWDWPANEPAGNPGELTGMRSLRDCTVRVINSISCFCCYVRRCFHYSIQ